MGALSPWHLLILAAVVVLFFGSKRMPDAARSLGRSMRILKAETRELRDDAPRTPAAAPPPAVPDDVASPLPETHHHHHHDTAHSHDT